MKRNSKKRLMITIGAAALALIVVALSVTFAYLRDSSEKITNTFDPQDISVDIDETTGDHYKVIPGTSADKDPIVTVATDIDAYLFLKVTDNTDGKINYYIEEGWLPLEGHDNVYYRIVDGSDSEQEFHVLKDDKVYYPSSLEKGDILPGTTLEFQSHAIQTVPFTSAEQAYDTLIATEAGIKTVDNAADLKIGLESGGAIELGADIDFTGSAGDALIIKKDVVIYGNGHTITTDTDSIFRTDTDDISVVLADLTLKAPINGRYNTVLRVDSDNVEVAITNCNILADHYPLFLNGDNTDINISGTTIQGYCDVYSRGADLNLSSSDFTLIGNNYYPASESNGFANIVCEGADAIVSIEDSSMKTISDNGNLQGFFWTRADNVEYSSSNVSYIADGNEVNSDFTQRDILDDKYFIGDTYDHIYNCKLILDEYRWIGSEHRGET